VSERISVLMSDIAPRPGFTRGKAFRRSYSAWRLCFFNKEPRMIAERDNYKNIHLSPPPAWAEVWHLWTVIVPRRSITGGLVFGQVWRRLDGRHWIYKKFAEYGNGGAE
jgi:hypothetical protein